MLSPTEALREEEGVASLAKSERPQGQSGVTHTPGPWTVERRALSSLIWGRAANGHLAVVHQYSGPMAPLEAEAVANARLMAAAPEMAEALEPFATVASIIRPDLPDDTVIQLMIGGHVIYHIGLGSLRAARAAIANAEGQS